MGGWGWEVWVRRLGLGFGLKGWGWEVGVGRLGLGGWAWEVGVEMLGLRGWEWEVRVGVGVGLEVGRIASGFLIKRTS